MDSNIDRIWWSIIIIVIGGLMFAIASVAFPEILQSVVDFFEDALNNAYDYTPV